MTILTQVPRVLGQDVAQFGESRFRGHVIAWDDTNVQESFARSINGGNASIDALSDRQDDDASLRGLLQVMHDVLSVIREIASTVALQHNTFYGRC